MASAVNLKAVRDHLKNKGSIENETEPVDQPLIVVVRDNGDDVPADGHSKQFTLFNGMKPVDPDHTKRKEFQSQSRAACGAFCDFGKCSFHGVSSCLILYFLVRGAINILMASVLLNLSCSDDPEEGNLHQLDNSLGADFPYSCSDFHTELYLQLFDGIFACGASIMAMVGLIAISAWCLIPVVLYGMARIVYLLILISMYSDFVNIGAIIGVLFSIGWTMVFWNTFKIVWCLSLHYVMACVVVLDSAHSLF